MATIKLTSAKAIQTMTQCETTVWHTIMKFSGHRPVVRLILKGKVDN